jgi:hypothetical protein
MWWSPPACVWSCVRQAVVFHPVHAAVKSVRLKDGRKLEFSKVCTLTAQFPMKCMHMPRTSFHPVQ